MELISKSREMSGSGSGIPLLQANQTAQATFNDAFLQSRDLSFYLLSALIPAVVVLGLVLFTSMHRSLLGAVSLIAGIIVTAALFTLLHDLIYDIAGYPDYKMPVWTILYSILYVIEGFTFLFFGLHSIQPGVNYVGIEEGQKGLVDCLYLSLARTFGVPPEGGIEPKTQLARFLPLLQSGMMMFLNVVIITKFVSAF
jgi:hypothetical protein